MMGPRLCPRLRGSPGEVSELDRRRSSELMDVVVRPGADSGTTRNGSTPRHNRASLHSRHRFLLHLQSRGAGVISLSLAHPTGGSRTRSCDDSGPPSCCMRPPVTRSPRSIVKKPAASNSSTTAALGKGVVAGKEDHPATARLVRVCAQDACPKRVGGLTTWAPRTRSATISLELRPPRSAFHAFVASMTD